MPQYDLFEENLRQSMEDDLPHLPSYDDGDNLNLNKRPQLFYDEILSSINDWEVYMYCKEHQVLTQPESSTENIPPMRPFESIQFEPQNNVAKNSFPCSKIEIRSHDDIWTDDTSEEQRSLKKLAAEAEKCRGNIAYKAGDYIKACEHYSNSVSTIPLIESYNNRAQANIKLENYTSALLDLDEVLQQDPSNLKALNRRALCRHKMRLYHEALCDLQTVVDRNPKCKKESLILLAEIKKEMAALKGRKYRMRSSSDRYKTFEVDVSQLPVYATFDGHYMLEVDKSGCAKSCVCNFCLTEDQFPRYRSNTLRIRERPRWQPLTSQLLKELHVDVNATVTNSSSAASAATANHSICVAARNGSPKNDHSKLADGAVTNGAVIGQFYDKLLRDKITAHEARNNSPKSDNASVISTAANQVIALPAASPTIDQSKSVKDSQNLSHQRAGSVENAVQKLHLEDLSLQNGDVDDILKSCSPEQLKKRFDSRLDGITLGKIINFVCMNFEPEGDWPFMLKYLRAITELERFNIVISFIDMQTKNELMSVFSKAIESKMENASELKFLFFP